MCNRVSSKYDRNAVGDCIFFERGSQGADGDVDVRTYGVLLPWNMSGSSANEGTYTFPFAELKIFYLVIIG